MYWDGILPGRAFEAALVLSLTLGPLVCEEGFHRNHWTWAWLGAIFFNLRYSWSVAAQGFMVGLYVNGIG
jgi:hypothetical protein